MCGSSSAIRIFLAMRQGEGEAGALAAAAVDPHAAAEMLDDLAADMQAEAAAVRLGGERVARLAELVEDQLLVGRIDARAVVAHLDAQRAAVVAQRHADAPAARL